MKMNLFSTSDLDSAAESKASQRSNVSTSRPVNAFTLIEILVVIAIAVIIAGLLITAGGQVVQKSNINRAISERDQLETAIEAYRAKYGYYPPSNAFGNALTNQLYYELLGTTANVENGVTNFTTLDGGSQISAPAVASTFGVSAFMNCSKGGGDDSIPAQTFLSGLKAGEIASNGAVNVIVTAANSDVGYSPMPGFHPLAGRQANPWRYVYPGTNNPSSYDLWVQVFVGNKTNLICNWAKQPQLNVPMP
ncbi:MAG TPA: prepilin-type N-terminal cleavage/methylation domain-containing protein [Verrucomicrobiae bacterium]|nr:prepilin-type N-terminal cleavage/methylation domain-containing protein [Verrucomicrobiae bacterium]